MYRKYIWVLALNCAFSRAVAQFPLIEGNERCLLPYLTISIAIENQAGDLHLIAFSTKNFEDWQKLPFILPCFPLELLKIGSLLSLNGSLQSKGLLLARLGSSSAFAAKRSTVSEFSKVMKRRKRKML